MLQRLHEAGRLSDCWFTADEAFGQNPGLREWLAERRVLTLQMCITRNRTGCWTLRAIYRLGRRRLSFRKTKPRSVNMPTAIPMTAKVPPDSA